MRSKEPAEFAGPPERLVAEEGEWIMHILATLASMDSSDARHVQWDDNSPKWP